VNGEFAIHYLQLEGISILASDLGDIYPRKVYFAPRTGRVFVRQLRSLRDDTIVRIEQAYLERLKKTPVAGDVELF
jgi:chemotaxis protein CheD